MTGKEKILATRPIQEVRAVSGAVSDFGESEAVGNGSSSPISFRFNSNRLSPAPQPPPSLQCVRTVPQLCRCKSDAMLESAPERMLEA